MDIHSLISQFSYIGIFLLMIANGVVNFPSSQLLYVVCGYFVSTGALFFWPVILAGALGNTVGNMITFLLVSKYGKSVAKKLLFVDEATFEMIHTKLGKTFETRGMWYIFFGKLIPSVKAFIPIIAGLAKTGTVLTTIVFLIASLLWAAGIVSLGYFFGEHVSFFGGAAVSFLIGIVIMLLVYRKFSEKN